MPNVSVRECARQLGLSHTALLKAIRKGTLRTVDGLLDVEDVLRRRRALRRWSESEIVELYALVFTAAAPLVAGMTDSGEIDACLRGELARILAEVAK